MYLSFRTTMTPKEANEIITSYTHHLDSHNGDKALAVASLAVQYGKAKDTMRKYVVRAKDVLRNFQTVEKPEVGSSIVTLAEVTRSEEPQEPTEPVDQVELRRHKDRATEARAQVRELEKRLVKAEDIRGSILDLGEIKYSRISSLPAKNEGRRSVILHVSDIQYGETIDFDTMDGLNSYSVEIANARIRRFFQKAVRFMTELWHGDPAERVYLLLNGDMISGAIHLELDRTDGLRPMEAARMVAEQLASGIALIREHGFPVEIIATPGNHGRATIKPESKGHVFHNYDTLVSWFIEMMFNRDDGVDVYYSKSVDALFSIYGFPMLASHGDRIGSRGGTGFLGATATILRGHHKVFTDYSMRGTHLYKIFTGHFHTPCVTVWGYANNTMAGVSEFGRDGRMTVTPASQDYFVIHDEHGIIEHRVIFVGDPSEGSSHEPRAKYS